MSTALSTPIVTRLMETRDSRMPGAVELPAASCRLSAARLEPGECPRCGYVGWARRGELTETLAPCPPRAHAPSAAACAPSEPKYDCDWTMLGGVSQRAVDKELWGAETRKAIANFPVSGEPIPASVARWLGRIKARGGARERRPRPARRRQGRADRRRGGAGRLGRVSTTSSRSTSSRPARARRRT